jgi:DNA invertase Pin-like site-specific DNA recombinase
MEELDRKHAPGKASKVFGHLADVKVEKVVVFLRESTRGQRQNMPHQRRAVLRAVAEKGVEVIATVRHVGNGADAATRRELERAVRIARKHGASVVAESSCRFVRPPGYNTWRSPDLRASAKQLRKIKKLADGVQLLTVLHPDLSNEKVMVAQSKRGQHGTGKKGGRPPVKAGHRSRRRAKLLPALMELLDQGTSVRDAARQVGVPSGTAFRWVAKLVKNGAPFPRTTRSTQVERPDKPPTPRSPRDFKAQPAPRPCPKGPPKGRSILANPRHGFRAPETTPKTGWPAHRTFTVSSPTAKRRAS